ncbi:hypothetical protein FHX56_005188, partial [Paraburkholderia tropica]|nr:hypothetical protein [Paraburkholderia tropica]
MQMSKAKRPSQGTAVFLFLLERSGYAFFPTPKRQNPGSPSGEAGVLDVLHKKPDDYLLS